MVESELNRCINSLLKQTYSNLEILLVDDGSKDRCPQMCDEYAAADARVRVIHKSNGFLVSERDINRYADYVCQLIETPNLCQSMGVAGVKTSHRYNADRIMPQWQDLFVSLTFKEPSSGRTE